MARIQTGRNIIAGLQKAEDVYVSDFENFLNRFLQEHPEVLEDQRRGMSIYWDKKVDWVALEKAQLDAVRDTQYGFHAAPQRPRR